MPAIIFPYEEIEAEIFGRVNKHMEAIQQELELHYTKI